MFFSCLVEVFVPDCGQQLFIISRKGGILVAINDYVYRSNLKRHGRENNKIYWECVHNRSTKCRGRLKTIGDDLYITNDSHNHEPDYKRIECARLTQTVMYNKFSLLALR